MTKTEPDLTDLLGNLWNAKFFLLTGAVTGLFLALIFIGAAVPHYRATMLIAPAERATGPDIKALLPDNSSFAVQYMLNTLGSPDSGDYVRFEHTMRETSVAASLLQNKKTMNGISEDRLFSFREKPDIKTAEELAAYLQDRIKIEPVGTSPLRRLVYDHPDRVFATYLLRALHDVADNNIRQEIRDRTQNREAYLQKALATTEHPDHRRALTSLLMEQEHVRMILAMDEPFAAIIAEPPSSGVKPQWPRMPVILPVFIMIGMILAFAAYSSKRLTKA